VTDATAPLLTFALASVAALALLSLAALRAWHGWLDLRRAALAARQAPSPAGLDVAALRQRVRRLEAIASGLDR
jgi:hypothetical protein